MSNILRLFELSKVNGGVYIEPEPYPVKWPEGTWLQRRRRELAEKELTETRGENG